MKLEPARSILLYGDDDSTLDGDAHAAGCALDHPPGILAVTGIEVRRFQPHDLVQLRLRDLPDLVLIGDTRALGKTRRFFQQRVRPNKRRGLYLPDNVHPQT